MNFRHFKTLKQAKAYIQSRPSYEGLVYRKKKANTASLIWWERNLRFYISHNSNQRAKGAQYYETISNTKRSLGRHTSRCES